MADSDRDEAKCMWSDFLGAVTKIMRVMGVQETVDILRSCADKLEANKPLLESKRQARRPVGRA